MERSLDKYREGMLCRACLAILEENSCTLKHHIFRTPNLAKKLIICTSLTVEAQDGFPRYLCDCCYQKINEFHQFQTMCMESVQRLRDIMQRQDVQFIAFEDEKPEFDLGVEANSEITIAEPNILLQYENDCDAPCDSLEADDPKVAPSMRRSKRTATRMSTLESLGKAFEKNVRRRKIKRNDRSRIRYISGKKSQKAAGGVQEKPNPVNSIKDEEPEVRLTHSSPVHKILESEDVSMHEGDTKSEKSASKELDLKRSKGIYRENSRKLVELASESIAKKSQQYQCDVCPMRFFVEHRLVAHKRSHQGLMPYPCSFEGCERGFNRWHCLKEHLRQHAGTNQWYTCSEEGCGKVYKHKPTLSMHLRRFHKKGPELKSHVCEICGKVFKSSAILNDHRYTHKDKSELPYACSEPNCDRRFSSKEKLKVHGMRHAGIKNYICSYCGMRKTTRNELKIHINYHTLERTWPCRFCQHVCNSAGNLKMHVRTVHERAKDYACRFCERTFAKPDTRKYHEMTHTGEKPNECNECGKRFTQPAALRTHKKIHLRSRVQVGSTQENIILGGGVETKDGLKSGSTLEALNSATETYPSQELLAQSTELTPPVVSEVQDLLPSGNV